MEAYFWLFLTLHTDLVSEHMVIASQLYIQREEPFAVKVLLASAVVRCKFTVIELSEDGQTDDHDQYTLPSKPTQQHFRDFHPYCL